jgi:hypothetical protein
MAEGLLYERIDGNYARIADDKWLTFLAGMEGRADGCGVPFARPDHSHWRWHVKVDESAHLLSCPTLAVECDGEPQGLMLLKTDGHFAQLPNQERKPLVYVPYLATAPWNQRELNNSPKFSGVGTVLMRAAVMASLEAEFKGRVGLHSLPKAEGFYECHGFQCLGVDLQKDNLKYYELSPEAAAEFMR